MIEFPMWIAPFGFFSGGTNKRKVRAAVKNVKGGKGAGIYYECRNAVK